MDHTLARQGNDGVDNEENVNEDQCENDSESLELAIESGDIERVNILIDRCTNQQCQHLSNALHKAVIYSNIEMVDFLIKKGADINQPNRFHESPLHKAVIYSNIEMVDFLIKKGANMNQPSVFDASPLHKAVIHSNIEMVDFFIKKGADVNQLDMFDKSPLHKAVQYSNIEMVDFLIMKGADVNQLDMFDESPLHKAVIYSNIEMVRHLVDNGPDVCLQNPFQMTALHYAVREMKAEIVEFLLGKNARPDAKNDTGATAFDLAIQLGDTEIIQLLLPKMESAPFLSTKSWRSALHLESAEALMFTFKEHLSVEPIKVFEPPPLEGDDDKARCIRYLHDHAVTYRYMYSIPKGPVQYLAEKPEASLLPNPDLCRQLDPKGFLIENRFAISCLTITDSNWPSQQTPIPEAYNQLEQVEGFFCIIAKRPKYGFTGGNLTEEPLRPVFSVTTCGDTPVKLIESIEDLITPLIEKLGRTFENNYLQAGRQLSNARLEVLGNGGRNEGLLPRLLSDATVIEYMTENHAHIVRFLTGLIDCVAKLQDGPWKLSEKAEKDSREGIKRLEAHRETLRELLERSQNIIQLFVFLPLLFVALEGSLERYFAWLGTKDSYV
ncbi:hypothetical protein FHL15_004555 [Xylaria flabelliformis]|uniref:Uncharacterized protein n=1 Tax=Xylaria flabelliformis TaxID=2512241 RepID=A0A553I2G6_9PEZI|nr:hypothetical protein FHL15_004555 [Xylaria flabelliformis]